MSTKPAFLFGGVSSNAVEEDTVVRDFKPSQPRDAQLPKYPDVKSHDRRSLHLTQSDSVSRNGCGGFSGIGDGAETGLQSRFRVTLPMDQIDGR